VIGIAAPDRVNLTKLQRQLVHATGRVGAFRVEWARAANVDATALDPLFAVKMNADSIVTFLSLPHYYGSGSRLFPE
jgi:molybdopterin/thiamine biosynthesis adenylyltransferase